MSVGLGSYRASTHCAVLRAQCGSIHTKGPVARTAMLSLSFVGTDFCLIFTPRKATVSCLTSPNGKHYGLFANGTGRKTSRWPASSSQCRPACRSPTRRYLLPHARAYWRAQSPHISMQPLRSLLDPGPRPRFAAMGRRIRTTCAACTNSVRRDLLPIWKSCPGSCGHLSTLASARARAKR
jgi:hypothetical protein